MSYTRPQYKQRRKLPQLIIIVLGILILLVAATVAARQIYYRNLDPVSSSQRTVAFVVEQGATVEEIAQNLQKAGLIRSPWAFRLYVSSKEVRDALQAGTYSFTPSQSTPEIVAQLTHGRVTTNLVTILPGQRLDQLRESLINDGFSAEDIDQAFQPQQYESDPALVDKPAGTRLEGYLYPDSFQKDGSTSATTIVQQSLAEMRKRLTPDLRAGFAKQGLSTYEAIILASIVEREVPSEEERAQVAQVFLSRLRIGMALESNATTAYGAVLDGKEPSSSYRSAYNTYQNPGLPPTPISNMTESSLKAVAYPAQTDWLFFVSGDDGVTRFSKTLAEHEAYVRQYCHKNCRQP